LRSDTSYKNCSIRGESFQREKNGKWVAQYLVTGLNAACGRSVFPSQQYQLSEIFATEGEADDFAVRRAMEWIDNINGQPPPG
jgi:hypothetical protein